jgi:flagellar basal body P-ring protein FlgI
MIAHGHAIVLHTGAPETYWRKVWPQRLSFREERLSKMRRAPYNFCRIIAPLAVVWTVVSCGCSGPILRPQSPEARIDLPPMPDVKYVSAYTQPYGMNYVQIEAVSLVSGLAGTGSDPPPSSQRAALLDEMKRHQVENPNELLASGNYSLVLARAFLRPGLQEGDRFDVEVRVPSRSETTSLRNGWMLPARLTEMAVLEQQVRQGHVLGLAKGPILVDPMADAEKDTALATRGRILGGGIATKSRPLGLVFGQQNKSFLISQQIGVAINRRFHTYVNGRKQGVATPKTDDFIELIIHPRYKDNVSRYMHVIRNMAIEESAQSLQARLMFLEQQLADPLTASSAAIRLEAIGDDQAKDILRKALASTDQEVRFYAAEALAYLDETAAVEVLADVALNEPSFRVNSLAALSAMDDVMAYDALRTLLEAKSAETRYGAFRALWAMNEHDPLVRGETLNKEFSFHVLEVPGAPMVHVTRSFRPEIVLFGKDHRLQLPLVLDAGKSILVNGRGGDTITISRFTPGAEPEQRVVSTDLNAVIRSIVELGGTYPDVVQALQQAKTDGALTSRFEVDALPEGGRSYDRDAPRFDDEDSKLYTSPSPTSSPEIASPTPQLFHQ